MEIKQLQTIEMILKKGSFLKAAEELGYVQSTVSLHIQQLEEELKITIFEKQGRRMVLSQEGEVFWEHARQLLSHADQVKETLEELSQGQLGHIRIGAIETIGQKMLPPILIEFLREFPKVTIALELNGTNNLCHRVFQDELDIGIGPILPNESSGLRKIPLFVEKVVLLLPQKHPLATKEKLTLQEIGNSRLIVSEPLSSYRLALEQRFLEEGIHFKPAVEITDSKTIIQFVQGGIGLALLPVSAIDPIPPDTIVREVAGVELGLTMGLIRKEKRLGKAALQLFSTLQEKLKNSI